MLNKTFAFLKKDFLVETSYKIAFIFNISSVFICLLTYFFIDKLFGQEAVKHLEEFGVNYFSYVILSIAFFSYAGIGLGSFSSRIRNEQLQGTLESILLTPTKISTILFSLSLWNLCIATFNLLLYILLGIFLFKIDFSNLNFLAAFVILLLSIISFSSIGIISASFIIVFKQGNPIGWLISNFEGLIGGVFFPITIMPEWIQFIAHFFPITYAIRAIELAVYQGFSVIQLSREIGFLLLFSSVFLPLSFTFFKFALRKARQDGSLLQY